MNSFGLGLILNFTDNASAGMSRATRTFNEMSGMADSISSSTDRAEASIQALTAAGVSMSMVGSDLASVGQSIFSAFSQAIGQVNSVGTTILTARTQLSSLYGSAEEGANALAKIKEYAKSSIFDFESLIPSVIMLKANGIEAFDAITSSTGKSRQMLMDYAADLAAFNPQMRNAYGTGIQAAMGAINEYIAEGNAMSLKRGASLDITALLGEEKGATIEERSRQIADLLEKLGMVGMTAQLAGTPMQRLSNAQDVLFDMMTRISDSGVFEKYTDLIAKLTDYIFAIPDDELQSIAETIGGALVSIMSPLETLIDIGLTAVDWLRGLLQRQPEIAKMLTVGVALGGAFLIVAGNVLKFAGSMFLLMSALQGFRQMGSLTVLMGAFGRSLTSVLVSALPLIGISYLIYLAWSRNIGGIADTVSNTLGKAIDTVVILFDALFDNTLSVDRWEKARKLGILPFIESVLDLKYSVQQTLGDIQDFLIQVLGYVIAYAPQMGEYLSRGFSTALSTIRSFVSNIPGMLSGIDWRAVSGAVIIGLVAVFKPSLFTTILSPILSGLSSVGGVVVSRIALFVGKTLPFKIISAIVGAIGGMPVLIGSAIIAAIGALVSIVYDNGDTIVSAFNSIWSKIPEPIRSYLEEAFGFVSTFVNNVIDSLGLRPAVNSLISTVGTIIKWFKVIGDSVVSIISTLISWVTKAWDGWLKDLILNVAGLVSRVVELLAGLAAIVLPIISSMVNDVLGVVLPIVDIIGSVLNGIIGVINGFLDFILGVFTGDWERAWQGIVGIFTSVFGTVVDIFKGIINSVIGLINVFIRGLNKIKIPGTDIGINIPEIPKLSTGGFVKSEGVSYLHPNEVVVNSPMTKNLGSFLDDYQEGRNTPVTPVEEESDSEQVIIDIPDDGGDYPYTDFPIPYPSGGSTSSPSYDYSVTFSAGSIVIQASNMSEAELEAAAEKLMKIIERKQKLKSMSTRRS